MPQTLAPQEVKKQELRQQNLQSNIRKRNRQQKQLRSQMMAMSAIGTMRDPNISKSSSAVGPGYQNGEPMRVKGLSYKPIQAMDFTSGSNMGKSVSIDPENEYATTPMTIQAIENGDKPSVFTKTAYGDPTNISQQRLNPAIKGKKSRAMGAIHASTNFTGAVRGTRMNEHQLSYNTISSQHTKGSPFRQKYYEEYYRMAAETRQKSQPDTRPYNVVMDMSMQGRNVQNQKAMTGGAAVMRRSQGNLDSLKLAVNDPTQKFVNKDRHMISNRKQAKMQNFDRTYDDAE
jgi:hypothetical protein